MTTRFLLLRHAETAGNAEGRTQGRRDPPLTERGRAQAALLGEALAAYHPVALYSSPASRARTTANEVARVCGLEVQVDERLHEMDHGDVDGLTGEEIQERFPEFLERWRHDDPADLRMPGGETFREAQVRMLAAAADIASRHTESEVVVVSHNLSLHTLLCEALGVPLSAFRSFRIDLASLSVAELREGDTWSVVMLNERCHLAAAGESPLVDESNE